MKPVSMLEKDHKKSKQQDLKSCQKAFSEIILNTKVPSNLNAINFSERLSVYQINYHQSLMGCLLSTFIQTQRLISSIEFENLADLYIDQHPSTHENLTIYGDCFASFLKTKNQHPALIDLATYDYYRLQCYYAKNHTMFDLEAFLAIPEKKQLASTFMKSDSLIPFASHYEIKPFVNIQTTTNAHQLEQTSTKNYYLFYRELGKVKFKTIEELTYKALMYFKKPRSLEELSEKNLNYFTHLVEKNYLIQHV